MAIAGSVVALAQVAVFVATSRSTPAAATPVSGGEFVATAGRVLDTRAATQVGPYSTPMPAGTWRSVPVDGLVGVPASGVSAVAVTLTAVSPSATGQIHADQDLASPPNAVVTYLNYTPGLTASNTAVIAVGSNGKIQVQSSKSTDLLVDVQGYYTAGDPAAGGYVPVAPTRLVDTRSGLGAPQAVLTAGTTLTVQASGHAGIPAGAIGVVVNFTVLDQSSSPGYLVPWAADQPAPTVSLNYPGVLTATAIAAQVGLATTGATVGAFNVNDHGASINLLVDVVGYFTAGAASGVFTPSAARVFDSRVAPNVSIAPDATATIPVAGVAGTPTVSAGVAAVVTNTAVIDYGTGGGYIRMWADGTTEPATASSLNFVAPGITANMITAAVGSTSGAVKIHNHSGDTIDIVVDVEGWYSTPGSAATSPSLAAGQRRNATRLPFNVSGTSQLSVDVGTGNALFTDQLLSLPGVTGDVPISLYYNSTVFGSRLPSAVTGDTGSGWGITGFDERLFAEANTVTLVGPGGLSGAFTETSTGYAAPPQFQADLATVSGGGWTLTEHASQEKLTFNAAGRLTSDTDRNGNTTSYSYDSNGDPLKVVSSRGGSPRTTLNVTVSGGRITGLLQTDGSQNRTLALSYSAGGHLASVTDLVSGITRFSSGAGTDTGQVVVVTNPAGSTTTLGFTAGQVSQVAQSNTAAGSPGTSITRLSYPSDGQTLVADPTTNQSSSVSAVPHTTYDLDSAGTMLVHTATDPDGHARSKTYTSLQSVASSTPAAGGATSLSYAANNGESLTKVASAAGASTSAAYGNAGAAQYSPSSSTDDASNALNYSYDTLGNQSGTTQGTSGPQAKVTHNTDGTVATSASPGAATGVVTTYGYDSSHNLSTITAPAGTGLGVRTYTYDGFARLRTATDGRGNTTTYSYDNADRITLIHSSDGYLPDVSYSYDSLNRVQQRTSTTGTSTYGYDDLGKLLSVTNTAGGGSITYTYDLGGNLASETDAHGTTSYGYDAAQLLTSMTYPKASGTHTTIFANDANGRRTDSWLQSNTTHTTWAAHSHTDYDSSGRVKSVLGEAGPASAPVTVVNHTNCYAAAAVAPACPSTATADRSNVRWMTDAVSGETSTYTYNTDSRLTAAVVTGGSNPRTYSYGYDAAGNRTSSSVTGSTPSSQTLTFNAANQISSTGYSYDAGGNQTAQSGNTASYNAFQQQTKTVAGAVTTTYSYAGSGQQELLSQSSSGGGDTYRYTYGRTDQNGLPIIETEARVTGGTTYNAYIAHDPAGMPVMLTTSTGTVSLYLYDTRANPLAIVTDFSAIGYTYTYDPYGNPTRTYNSGGTGDYQNPYLYATGVQDRTTGHLHYGNRTYDPYTGTWTQQDNLNRPLDPTTANRYQYGGSNPVNHADPSGANWFSDAVSSFWNDPLNVDPAHNDAQAQGLIWGTSAGIGGLIAGGPLGAVGGFVGGYLGGYFASYYSSG